MRKKEKGKREKRKEKKKTETENNRGFQAANHPSSFTHSEHLLLQLMVCAKKKKREKKRVATVLASQAKVKQQNERLVKSKNIVQVIMYVL